MAKAKKIPLIEDFDNIPAEALVPEEEQPYLLPAHWKWVRLKWLCAINPPKPKVIAYPVTTEVNFIPMASVSEAYGAVVNLELRPLEQVAKGYTSFRDNDVILAKITPCFENGKSAVIPRVKYGFGYGSTEFYVLRCGKLLDPMFLHLLVRQQKFIIQGKAVMTGAVGQQRVPKAFLENYPFPLPPIEEQKQIVAYLDEKLGKIDSVRNKLQDFLDHADRRKDNLIQAGVTGHLTSHWREEHLSEASQDTELPEGSLVPEEEQPYPIPAHWKWVRLGALIELVRGVTYKKNEIIETGSPDAVLVLRGGNVREGAISLDSDNVYVPKGIIKEAQLVRKNDVVIVSSTGSSKVIGRAGVSDKTYSDVAFGAFLTLCRSASLALDKRYLATYFQGSLYRTVIRNLAAGVNINNIKGDHLRDLVFPLPPMGEQEEIARILDKQLERAEKTDKLVAEVLERLDTMKQQLVSAALAGRLSLQVS